jgi:hypothetical protein
MLPVALRYRNCTRMYVMGLQPGFSSGPLIGCPVGPVVSFMLTLFGYFASSTASGTAISKPSLSFQCGRSKWQ